MLNIAVQFWFQFEQDTIFGAMISKLILLIVAVVALQATIAKQNKHCFQGTDPAGKFKQTEFFIIWVKMVIECYL